MVKVSVILPIYNVEKYLPKCLDSLIAQTLKDIEIICVNDESTDNSLKILEDYATNDNRINIINQKNVGPGISRNNGIMKARGEYIAFCDPDDWIEANAYEKLYNIAKDNNADLVEHAIVVHEEIISKKERTKIKNNLYSNEILNVNQNPKVIFKGISAAWNKLCSAKLIKEKNIKFSEGYCAEDQIFSISLKVFSNKIIYIDEPFYHYLHRKSSITHKKSAVNLSVPDFMEDVLKFLQKENIYKRVEKEFWERVLGLTTMHYRKLPDVNIKEYKQKCKNFMPKEIWVKFDRQTKEKNIFNKIFSFYFNGKCYELTILGIKIKI